MHSHHSDRYENLLVSICVFIMNCFFNETRRTRSQHSLLLKNSYVGHLVHSHSNMIPIATKSATVSTGTKNTCSK